MGRKPLALGKKVKKFEHQNFHHLSAVYITLNVLGQTSVYIQNRASKQAHISINRLQ